MTFKDVVVTDAVVESLKSTEVPEILDELTRALATAGAIPESDVGKIRELLLDREKKGSTALGGGVAIPHVKMETLERPVAAIGLRRSGVEFRAIDGEPVYVVFLILTRAADPKEHVLLMSRVARLIRESRVAQFMKEAKSREEILEALSDCEDALG